MSSTSCPTETSPSTYGSDYYQSENYTGYLERGPRYAQMASELCSFLRQVSLLNPKASTILDYGCAIGFMLDGLKAAGCQQAVGYDMSEWAVHEATRRGHAIINRLQPADIMLALDVFEHMDDDEIIQALLDVHPKVLICRIPAALRPGGPFALECSRKDKTHINCKTDSEWTKMLWEFPLEFTSVLRLNLHTIYDSPGVFCFMALTGEAGVQ